MICAPRSSSQRTASRRPRQAANISACSCAVVRPFTSAPRLTKSPIIGMLPSHAAIISPVPIRSATKFGSSPSSSHARTAWMSPASIAAPKRTGSGSSPRAAAAAASTADGESAAASQSAGERSMDETDSSRSGLSAGSEALIVAKSCAIVKARAREARASISRSGPILAWALAASIALHARCCSRRRSRLPRAVRVHDPVVSALTARLEPPPRPPAGRGAAARGAEEHDRQARRGAAAPPRRSRAAARAARRREEAARRRPSASPVRRSTETLGRLSQTLLYPPEAVRARARRRGRADARARRGAGGSSRRRWRAARGTRSSTRPRCARRAGSARSVRRSAARRSCCRSGSGSSELTRPGAAR